MSSILNLLFFFFFLYISRDLVVSIYKCILGQANRIVHCNILLSKYAASL